MKKKELLWMMEKMMRFIDHAEGCSSFQIKHNFVDGKLYKVKRTTSGKCDCGYERLIEEINNMKIFKER